MTRAAVLLVVSKPNSPIRYAAHTVSCTFLLDAEGICRSIVMQPGANKRREVARAAARCVGAQYVASLDSRTAGHLVEMPKTGVSMIFARVDERGRVSLVRTGHVTRFEEKEAEEDPFDDESVKTSAPDLTPMTKSSPPNRLPRLEEEDDYLEGNERTQRIQALRDDEIAALQSATETPVIDLARTDEYESGHRLSTTPTTLRTPVANDSEPYLKVTARAPWTPPPPPPRSEPQVSQRARTEQILPKVASRRTQGR